LKVRHFSSDAEVVAAEETCWTDRLLNIFLSGLQKVRATMWILFSLRTAFAAFGTVETIRVLFKQNTEPSYKRSMHCVKQNTLPNTKHFTFTETLFFDIRHLVVTSHNYYVVSTNKYYIQGVS
jgi:hypothetical protein